MCGGCCKKASFKYLETWTLIRTPLENTFGVIHFHSGSNSYPNVGQFVDVLKTGIISHPLCDGEGLVNARLAPFRTIQLLIRIPLSAQEPIWGLSQLGGSSSFFPRKACFTLLKLSVDTPPPQAHLLQHNQHQSSSKETHTKKRNFNNCHGQGTYTYLCVCVSNKIYYEHE